MLPRSKGALAFLIALPLLLLIPLWQVAQKRPRLWGLVSTPVASLALSHDGSEVAYMENSGTFELWSGAQHRRQLQTERPATFYANAISASPPRLRFSSNDQILLASNIRINDSSTALYAWDTGTGRLKWTALSPFKDDFCRYWTSSDGKRAVQRSYGVMKVLDIAGQGTPQSSEKSGFARAFPVLARFQAPVSGKQPQTLASAPDGKTVAGATEDGQLEFWDATSGVFLSQTTPTLVSASTDWNIQYSPDSRFVALFDGTTLSVWDVGARKWTTTNVAASSSEVTLAWMPDSRSLWTGAGSIQQWDVATMKSLRSLPVGGPVAVSGDGRSLVTRALMSNGATNGIWVWRIG